MNAIVEEGLLNDAEPVKSVEFPMQMFDELAVADTLVGLGETVIVPVALTVKQPPVRGIE